MEKYQNKQQQDTEKREYERKFRPNQSGPMTAVSEHGEHSTRIVVSMHARVKPVRYDFAAVDQRSSRLPARK
jgi:hypothetical protein